MKRVARAYGLKVNRSVDERKDFDKSAVAASKLISKSCIPYAKKILYNKNMRSLFLKYLYQQNLLNRVNNKIRKLEIPRHYSNRKLSIVNMKTLIRK